MKSTECQELEDSLATVLRDAGEDPAAAALYAELLTGGARDLPGLAAVLDLDEAALTALSSRLIDLGLVRHDHDNEALLTAVGLEGPVSRIIASAEANAATQFERIARMRTFSAEAARLLRQVQSVAGREPESQILDSRADVVNFLHEMNSQCTTEVLALVDHNPPASALRQAREQDEALLAKGVRVRSIYLASARHQPGLMGYLRWLDEQGAQVALAPDVPVRTLVYDRHTALVSRNPEDLSAGAVVVRSPGLVTALAWLFELRWRQAELVHDPATQTEGPSTVELELLNHFAQGHKDAAIARRMGVSVRTVRRLVTQLSEQLGVSSRFELGATAAAMGWIQPTTPHTTPGQLNRTTG